MSDTVQIIGVATILFILIKEYVCAYKGIKLAKTECTKAMEEDIESLVDTTFYLNFYYEAKIFLISLVAVLILGVMLF